MRDVQLPVAQIQSN